MPSKFLRCIFVMAGMSAVLNGLGITQIAAIGRTDLSSLLNRSELYDPTTCIDNGSGTGSGATSTASGTYSYTTAGNIPAGGEQVGTTTYGGGYDSGSNTWYSSNDQQGGRTPHDDNGMGNDGKPLAGRTDYAELGNGTALGGLPDGTKLAITYNDKTIIAEKDDVGGGGGPVSGKPRDIDLWWETAELLGFTPGSGVVTIQAVDNSTPVTPVNGAASPAVSSPDASSGCCSGGSGATTPLDGSTNAEQAFNYFVKNGLNAYAAAGLVGNFSVEAPGPPEVDPSEQQIGGGPGRGIAQWSVGGRWDTLQQFAANQNPAKSPTDLGLQVAFVMHELKGSYASVYSQLKNVSSVASATQIVGQYYEGPADLGATIAQRTSDAQQFYNQFASSASSQPSTPAPAPGSSDPSSTSISLDSVVKKYGLQSVQVQELDGGTLGTYQADTPPATPASTMKLVIADTLLQNSVDLSQTVPVTADLWYDGTNTLGVSQITLHDALVQMLSVSDNTAANVLMKALGGPTGFTKAASAQGYTHTIVKGYYDPSNDGKNQSTISDEVAAMNHLYVDNGSDYGVAQAALRSAAQNDNNYNVSDEANKWAGTTDVAGNVGVFNINGHRYIIGLYYNGSDKSAAAISAMHDGSADIVQLIQSMQSGGGAAGSSGGCSAAGGPVSADATGIVQEAINLSWPDKSHDPAPTPAYQAALDQYNPGVSPQDCGHFVSTVMKASKADPNYPVGDTGTQYQYVESLNGKKYDVAPVSALSQLQPGDIVIEGGPQGTGGLGHTFIYIGKQPNGTYSASASLGSRSGDLDQDSLNNDPKGGPPIRARLIN